MTLRASLLAFSLTLSFGLVACGDDDGGSCEEGGCIAQCNCRFEECQANPDINMSVCESALNQCGARCRGEDTDGGVDSGEDSGDTDGGDNGDGGSDSGNGDTGTDGGGDDDGGMMMMADGGMDGGMMMDDAGSMDSGTDAGGGDDGGSDGGEVDSGPPVSMPCTAMGECDPFDPTSCGDGMMCLPGGDGTVCSTNTGTKAEGEECGSPSECTPGMTCVNFGDGMRICQRLCADGSIGMCGGMGQCTGTLGSIECVQICRPLPTPCNVLTQDCPDGLACTFATNAETSDPYTGCRSAGEQDINEPCGGDNGLCRAGTVCIRVGEDPRCLEVCDPDSPECTMGDQECSGRSSTWGISYCI